VHDWFVDLLRIEKTSSDVVRERMKCEVNKVIIGNVSIILYWLIILFIIIMKGIWPIKISQQQSAKDLWKSNVQ